MARCRKTITRSISKSPSRRFKKRGKRNREEYDARYGQIAELKRQAETEAHDIATSRDPLNAYGAAFPKWICSLPNDSRASFHLWHSFNEALVAEGLLRSQHRTSRMRIIQVE